jgi:hypothetical protein
MVVEWHWTCNESALFVMIRREHTGQAIANIVAIPDIIRDDGCRP